MSSPQRSSSSSSDQGENGRKRVCKACDRCRLKKSKCDGSSPCSRCKIDNAICVFGERKKSQDKVYPKGYVEMLEQQQAQLVTGLRELYKRLQTGERWPGSPLKESHGGHPLTHDILERLDLLHSAPDAPIKHEGFDDDLSQLQARCLRENGSPPLRRKRSLSEESEPGLTSSESSHSMSSPHMSSPRSKKSFVDSFSQQSTPPTPNMDRSFVHTTTPVKSQQYSVPPASHGNDINPMHLLQMQQQWMMPQQSSLEQMDVDFSVYTSPLSYDPQIYGAFSTQASDPMGSMMWNDPFNDFISPNAVQA